MFTLVVMAAGAGRRFGGDKQLAEVGPDGEAFLDYAIADAARAGAANAVIVVRSEIEDDIRSHVDARHGALRRAGFGFAYVRQDRHGPRRAKPWGTAHAVLSAEPAVPAEPGTFVVCNADDYYGASAMSAVAAVAVDLGDDEAGLCVYRLDRTLPDTGTVSRGVCQVSDGRLLEITEHHGLARRDGGAVASVEPVAVLDGSTPVSMNLWAFPRAAFGWIRESFDRFANDSGEDDDVECLLPTVVAERMARDFLTVRVVTTDEDWIGITNREDLETARDALRSLGARAGRRPTLIRTAERSS